MAIGKGGASRYNRRLRIERPVPNKAFGGAGSGSWTPVTETYAEVQDVLPSRAERLEEGINIAERPARVRMRFRADVTPNMRFVLLRWDGSAWVSAGRVMQIEAGPAEVGRRDAVEFMVKDYTSAGNGA